VAELVRVGATCLQIDAPHGPPLLDPETRAFCQVWTLDTRLSPWIEMDNAIREASRIVPLEWPAISAPCGVATAVMGNAPSMEGEQRKLRVLAGTAQAVWRG
jgi:hypothetical protein